MRCKDCPSLHYSDDGRYICWGVREPFQIDDINRKCSEYKWDGDRTVAALKPKDWDDHSDLSEVLDFISRFNEPTGAAREMFLNGKCYWFAVILSERFKEMHPDIAYNPIDGHFTTRIHGRYYDASGDVTAANKDKSFLWDKLNDQDWKSRITRDCIELVSC